jgi:ribulose-phosphate 3-epimerase
MPAEDHPAEVAASLMCADFSKLGRQLDELREAGVRRLHLDFADGAFVPSLLLGTEIFSLLAGHAGFDLESHLMIRDPERFAAYFGARSDRVIVHIEATSDVAECIDQIRDAGARPGLAVSPDTPIEGLEPLLPLVDQILIMTVQPGFAGAEFIPAMVDKVRWVHERAVATGLNVEIEVDGGINPHTIPALAAAGARAFVGGSSGLFVGRDLGGAAGRMLAAARSPRLTSGVEA